MVRSNASRDVASFARATRYGQGYSLYRDHEAVTRAVATVLVAVTIVAFQTNLVPYFAQHLSTLPGWYATYYGLGMLLLMAACAAFVLNEHARQVALPAVAICALSGSLVLLYPADVVSKNFLVAMTLCASLAILASFIDGTKVLHVAALAVAFNAVMCLMDIMVPSGFTNTAGRAAGLAQGPNMAASQLLLGAVVVWRAIPPRLLWSFLILVSAALVATLSRSALIIALMAAGAASAGYAIKHNPQIDAIRWRDIGVGAAIVCWMAAAIVANQKFSVASDAAYGSIGQAAKAITDVPTNIRSSTPAAARTELNEINKRVAKEGDANSASARSMLMRRAVIEYSMSPWTGVGPKEAHALAPHNTYLLLALAFGIAGLMVPVGFIWMAARTGNWEFPITLAALFAVSHDMLLFPSCIIILAIGLTATQIRPGSPRS